MLFITIEAMLADISSGSYQNSYRILQLSIKKLSQFLYLVSCLNFSSCSAFGIAGSYALPALISSGFSNTATHTTTAATGSASTSASSSYRSASGYGQAGGPTGSAVFVGSPGSGGTSAASSMSLKPSLNPTIIGLAILLAIAVSVAATLYPAWKASRIDPIEAIRSE